MSKKKFTIDMEALASAAEGLSADQWEYHGWPNAVPEIAIKPEYAGGESVPLIYIEDGLEDSGALEFAAAVVRAFGRGELIPNPEYEK